jgi:hypothetical protein
VRLLHDTELGLVAAERRTAHARIRVEVVDPTRRGRSPQIRGAVRAAVLADLSRERPDAPATSPAVGGRATLEPPVEHQTTLELE